MPRAAEGRAALPMAGLRTPLLADASAEQEALHARCLAALEGGLLAATPTAAPEARRRSLVAVFLQRLGVRSREEVARVVLLTLATFLANAFFVLARNVGTVLFLRYVDLAHLPAAMFSSGVLTVFVSSLVSRFARGASSITVHVWLLAWSALILASLYVGTLLLDDRPRGDPLASVLAFAIFVAEDVLAFFVMVQSAAVVQGAFAVADAKRLMGLVKMGNSIASMSIGLGVGYAALAGTEQLLAAQVVLSVVSIFVTALIGRRYMALAAGVGGERASQSQAPATHADACPWWRNMLVLAIGFWTFTVVLVQVIFEFQYNVTVVLAVSDRNMVALTGYLFAGAGFLSMVVHVVCSRSCLESWGVRFSILATPSCLLVASLCMYVSPSVQTVFMGRLVDLTLRWSFNSHVKSTLWVAVPARQAAAAKPWLEGAVGRSGSAIGAIVISAVLTLFGGGLCLFTSCLTAALLVACVRVYSVYLEAMWLRIRRREVHVTSEWQQQQQDSSLTNLVMDRLLRGGAAEQLYILREIGEGLSDESWERFFAHFDELSTAVQVKVIEICRKQRTRVPDKFLLQLLEWRGDSVKPAVLTAALIAIGERQIHRALKDLEVLLGSLEPSLRAAAATSILMLGWGAGLGNVSAAALVVLEEMLGFPLEGGCLSRRGRSPSKARQAEAKGDSFDSMLPLVQKRQRETNDSPDWFTRATEVKKEWEASTVAGDTGRAILLAVQLTHLMAAAPRVGENQSSIDATYKLTFAPPCDVPTVANGCSEAPRPPMISVRRLGTVREDANPQCADEDMVNTAEHRAQQRNRAHEVAIALEMLQYLPAPRELLSDKRRLELLQHPSHAVRATAIAFIDEKDIGDEQCLDERASLVRCLCSPDTYEIADAALRKLGAPLGVQTDCLAQLRAAIEDHHRLAGVAAFDAPSDDLGALRSAATSCKGVENIPASGSSQTVVAPGAQIVGLLKWIRRQRAWCPESALTDLLGSGACDELLVMGDKLRASDLLHEIHATLVDLRAEGFSMTKALAEIRVRQGAEKICKGLSVQRWVMQLGSLTKSAWKAEACQYLSLSLPPQHSCDKNGVQCETNCFDAVDVIIQIASRYIDERLYIERLQLLHLAILAADRTDDAVRAATVMAKWRLLRKQDPSCTAAALELLDTMLPSPIKGVVLPLLGGGCTIERQLEVGAELCIDFQVDVRGPPPWMQQWFESFAERLGVELGTICKFLSVGSPPLPYPPPRSILAPKLVKLWPMKQSADLLAIHMAEIAMISDIMHVGCGDLLCSPYETYVVVRGEFVATTSGRKYRQGQVVQELHALCEELTAIDVRCVSPEGGSVVRIHGSRLFEVMVRLPPKFALGLLKSLLRILPAPAQTGGQSVSSQRRGAHGAPEPARSPPLTAKHSLSMPMSPTFAPWSPKRRNRKDTYLAPADEMVLICLPPHIPDECSGDQEDLAPIDDAMVLTGLQPPPQHSPGERTGDREDCSPRGCSAIWSSQRPSVALPPKAADREQHRALCEAADGEPSADLGSEQVRVSARGDADSFSMLEKLTLLVGVKLFRYVPMEYLPAIAACLEPTFFASGDEVFQENTPTDGALYVVGDGVVGLQLAGVERRRLGVGDSMGNTALLLDHSSHYTARALEDVWLLKLSRRDLTDVLRGRHEVAAAVIRGLYKTLTRRMQQAGDNF